LDRVGEIHGGIRGPEPELEGAINDRLGPGQVDAGEATGDFGVKAIHIFGSGKEFQEREGETRTLGKRGRGKQRRDGHEVFVVCRIVIGQGDAGGFEIVGEIAEEPGQPKIADLLESGGVGEEFEGHRSLNRWMVEPLNPGREK